jgi:hypothetical protein
MVNSWDPHKVNFHGMIININMKVNMVKFHESLPMRDLGKIVEHSPVKEGLDEKIYPLVN